MNDKKYYEAPEIETFYFPVEDVITASEDNGAGRRNTAEEGIETPRY